MRASTFTCLSVRVSVSVGCDDFLYLVSLFLYLPASCISVRLDLDYVFERVCARVFACLMIVANFVL